MSYKWYVICAASAAEMKVCAEINRIALVNEEIKEAFVPTKKSFKIERGKKKEIDLKIFPTYVFVQMICNLKTLEIIRNIPKVLGFLGPKYKPNVVPDEKIQKYKEDALNNLAMEEENFDVGDIVRIIDGPFESFNGTVESRDDEKRILKISVSIFGRATSVDIDYDRVEKIRS